MARPATGHGPDRASGTALLTTLAVVATLGWGASSAAAPPSPHVHEAPVVLAPGYADLAFQPPAPGHYRLPPLGHAADGAVVDSGGRSRRLHDLYGDGIAVLSFIFTRCSDVNGCPLATFVLGRLQGRLQDEELADRVRLVSFSFDPDHDTPAVLDAYAGHFRNPGVPWAFVTSQSHAELDRLLDRYDQWVIRDVDGDGNPLGTISHVLRVYLIDAERQIRNIYSVSFLHADTVVNDIRTLLAEGG
jgi:cytochrome c peroxidase